MTILQFANNVKTTLASPITTTSTSITVAPGTGSQFPTPTTGKTFILTLVDAATGLLYEILSCTARSGDVLTVVRAQEGTIALNWSAGDNVSMFPTAGTMQNFPQLNGFGATGTWPINVTGSSSTSTSSTYADYLNSFNGVNKIGLGFSGSQLNLKIDATNFGSTFPMSITGSSSYATNAGYSNNSGTATNQSGGTVNATSIYTSGSLINESDAFIARTTGSMKLGGGPTGATDNVYFRYDGKISINYGAYSQIVTIDQFQLSYGVTGYTRLPNGFILQWGTVNIPTGNGDVVYYPIGFPNFCMNMVSSDTGDGSSSNCYSTGQNIINASYFRAYMRRIDGSNEFINGNYAYIALGI
jgi:hypothetical protein